MSDKPTLSLVDRRNEEAEQRGERLRSMLYALLNRVNEGQATGLLVVVQADDQVGVAETDMTTQGLAMGAAQVQARLLSRFTAGAIVERIDPTEEDKTDD